MAPKIQEPPFQHSIYVLQCSGISSQWGLKGHYLLSLFQKSKWEARDFDSIGARILEDNAYFHTVSHTICRHLRVFRCRISLNVPQICTDTLLYAYLYQSRHDTTNIIQHTFAHAHVYTIFLCKWWAITTLSG